MSLTEKKPRRFPIVERALAAAARLVLNHPWTVIGLYTVLAVVGALTASRWLGLQTAENALVSNELEYNQRYHRFLEAFGDQEYVYVVVEVDDLPTAMRVADAVATEIEPLREAGFVRECISRLATSSLQRDGLMFVPGPDLERLASYVEKNAGTITSLLDLDSLAGLCEFALDRLDLESARQHPELARFALEVLGDGVALLALRSKAQVIPAHISGIRYKDTVLKTFLSRHRVRVRYGRPVDLSEFTDPRDRQQVQAATQKIWSAIQALAPEDGKVYL